MVGMFPSWKPSLHVQASLKEIFITFYINSLFKDQSLYNGWNVILVRSDNEALSFLIKPNVNLAAKCWSGILGFK